jgi:c-di-AMP phosphodiesterase-like protein
VAELDGPKQSLHSKPRGALRVKYWAIVGSLLFVVFILMSSSRSPLHAIYLSFFCFLALVLAVMEGKKIWNLRAKRISRSTSLFIGLTLVGVLIALLALNDSGVFIWNQLYLDIPLTLYFLLRGVIAWITEWRKSVQVYEELEGFTFVLKK